MRLSFFVLFIILCGQAHSGCFSHHIENSIAINSKKRPLYAALTNGKSNKVFNALIASESIALAPANYYDFRASKYHAAGIDLFCKEFLEMDPTLNIPIQEPGGKFLKFDWKSYQAIIKELLKKKDFRSIRSVSLDAIYVLKIEPRFHCMTRHIVESIYRFAYFLPQRIEEARLRGLPSPEKLIIGAMKLQLFTLQGTYKIDEWSAPIQAQGIPVLCAELPDLLADLQVSSF